MAYVIYNKETTRIETVIRHRPYRETSSYKTHAAAKAALTRLSKAWWAKVVANKLDTYDDAEDPIFVYGIAEINYYREKIEQMVERTNMMTGKKYFESVNTPNYCSPSSEAYWSM